MTTGRRPRPRRLRTRVLAGVLALTITAFAAFDVVAVIEVRRYLLGRTDALLQRVVTIARPRIDTLLQRFQSGRPPEILRGDLAQLYLAYVPDHRATIVLETGAGRTPRLPDDLTTFIRSDDAHTVASLDGRPLRLRAARAGSGTLVVAADLHEVNVTVAHLRLVVVVGSLAAAGLIAIGLLLLLRRGLRPLETMAIQADRISTGELSRIGYPDDVDTEVGRLGAALNGMLTRIDAAIAEREADQEVMRRFFADASHELRTPLASMRANAELYEQGALARRDDVDEAMRRIRLEARRMSVLVDDMLRLARLDQHPEPQLTPVDLTALLAACLERTRVAEPDRRWQVDVEAGLVVTADEEMLQRALDNLFANVRLHAGPDARAALAAAREGDSIRIEVSDTGAGVPADRLPLIFDRFYRATSTGHTGSGLGLAIVAEIAALHGGAVEAKPNQPHGLLIRLTLPA